MQVWLPVCGDMITSIAVLSNRHLNAQRREAKLALDVLAGRTKGYTSHPCARQFAEYQSALVVYYNVALAEWERRGFKSEKLRKLPMPDVKQAKKEGPPWWLGCHSLHRSHAARLYLKDRKHYRRVFAFEADPAEYTFLYAAGPEVKLVMEAGPVLLGHTAPVLRWPNGRQEETTAVHFEPLPNAPGCGGLVLHCKKLKWGFVVRVPSNTEVWSAVTIG